MRIVYGIYYSFKYPWCFANEIVKAKEKENFSSLPYKGYLCNITVEEFEKSMVHHLPYSIKGVDFLEKYQVSIDRVTTIDPTKTYHIRAMRVASRYLKINGFIFLKIFFNL
jgi:hypothetical protein